MQSQLQQHPLHIRCDLISRWIEECTNKELECMLPDIVDEIFGITNRVGWDLLSVEFTSNPADYDNILKFLHPNGSMFRLCYKLLSDPYIKYKFSLSFLPLKVRQSIEDGTAISFYMEKLEVDPRTRTPIHLSLNPFELYMFHFMYHVVNPNIKRSPYQESRVFSPVYLRLAEEYLTVFLPCDGSTVYPELPSHYISQSPHRSMPQKPVRTSTLFRQDVLVKMLKQSPTVNTLQTSPHVGIWRSELTVQLCIDFWLSMPNTENLWGFDTPSLWYGHQSTISQTYTNSMPLWSEDQLPSCEHLHAVRLLVKHLHYFANSLIEDSSAMDELKKVIIPSSQQKVYHFIRQTMQHWPLDASFKQILEIWLSYIQPWRYIDFKTRYNRPRSEVGPVDSRWLPFIAENLLVYSVIFHQLIERFKMIDLASPRNAYMLFRLTKVFSQSNMCELLKQVEGSLGEFDSRGYNKWVRSHLLDLEGPGFQYKSIFCIDANIETFVRMVKEAELQVLAKLQEELHREEQMGIWEWLFGGGNEKHVLVELKNMLKFLTTSIENLKVIFQVPEELIENVTKQVPNTPLSSIRPTSVNQLSPSLMRKQLNDLRYEGDPDLQPIRSFENAFLVRLFYHICFWINYHYSSQMDSLYSRRDVVGGVVRQILTGPQIIHYFDKRIPGKSPRVSSSLPPRLSMRRLANYHVLIYLGALILFTKVMFGWTLIAITVVFLFLWFLYMVVRWLLGYAPVVPTVNMHDISGNRSFFSFNG